MSKRARHKQVARSPRRASRKVWLGISIALAAMLAVGVALFAGRSDEEATPTAATSGRAAASDGAVWPVVDVYKDATCGCCSKWVAHLEAHGFPVRTTDTRNLTSFKASHGVPHRLESCHTAVVDGYVVEGHVPAADVQRLLKERPAIAGLAVAGMPIGSPGMEVSGAKAEPYDVIAFDKQGATSVFATYR